MKRPFPWGKGIGRSGAPHEAPPPPDFFNSFPRQGEAFLKGGTI